jgi:predicted permease
MHLQDEDLGFAPERVVRGQVGIRQAAYADDGARIAFFDRLIDGVRALPEVESAALVSAVPFTTRFGTTPVGTQPAAGGATRRSEAVGYVAGEGWFGLMGIAITAGRDFSRADVVGGEPVAIVSDALANRLWPGDNPVGRYLRTLPRLDGAMAEEPGPWLRVVGVVADARREVGGLPPGDLYTSLRQSGRFWMHVVARARAGTDTERVLPAIEDVLHRIDPVVPLSSPLALETAVRDATAPTRFLAVLLAGFSAVAVLLAVMGLYGVIAYAARQRRRDVAIRMALGADRAEVAGLFLRQGMAVVLAGVALGTAGGYALGRALAGQLHGVGPGDPLTHAALAGLLVVTAGAAVWLPARRASAAEPMRVLREE